MKFGLFGGARARGGPAGDSEGYHDFINYVVEAERLGFSQRLPGRAPFHRLRPGLGLAQSAELSRRAHRAHPPRHRGGGAAVAQSGAGRRTGGDARSAVGRPARFRRRQGLSRLRVLRLLRAAGRGDRALRRGDGGHPQGLEPRGALFAQRQALALRQCRRRAERRCSARTRRSGSAPAAPNRSAAPRARATICCSTRSRSTDLIIERVKVFREECAVIGRPYDPMMVGVTRGLQIVHNETERKQGDRARGARC